MSKRTEELMAYDNEHIIHGMTPLGKNVGIVIEESDGIWLKDTDGRRLMDLSSQLINVNLGHRRPDILEVANAQLEKLSYSYILRGLSNLPSIELARKLKTIMPEGLDRYLWTNTGAETVDSSFRIANMYWRLKGTRKYKIISLSHAYHGTLRSVARATNIDRGIVEEMPPPAGHVRIPNYYCYRCAFDATYPGCGILCAKFLEYTIINEGKDSVAAFIAEPEQGASGFIAPVPEYWPMVREICAKYNVLLIADEVMTGFARTGQMFAVNHWKVIPDMMCTSKGIVNGYLPFGALAVNGEIFSTLKGQFMPVGSTESGNPVCCAIAMKCVDIYVKERVVENVQKVGAAARKRLEKEFLSLPYVGCVDGLGLMLGVEIVKDKETKEVPGPKLGQIVVQRGVEKGVLPRIVKNRLSYAPPCTVTLEDSNKALDILYSIFSRLKPEDLE